MKEKTDKILIDLEIGDEQALFIIIAKDGTINRKGNGNLKNIDHDMYMGSTNESFYFARIIEKITNEFITYVGKSFDIPEKKGNICKLKILLGGEEINTGLEFKYGDLSEGPPKEIVEFVISAVQLTDFWVSEFKKNK